MGNFLWVAKKMGGTMALMGLVYNTLAQTEDLPGCTDPAAINFNPEATIDDGTCLGTGCPDPEATNFDVFTLLFGGGNLDVCEYAELIEGCTDPQAENYDSSANSDDDSCIYGDLPGCMDETALNFNPNATEDDGSCAFVGCPDPAALNFDPISVFFGGGNYEVCEYAELIEGCTDPQAENYDSNANSDDGSCVYGLVTGCTDESAWNYNPFATEDDGSCFGLGSGSGCADPMALNFNPFFFLNANAGTDACEYGEDVMPDWVPGCTDPLAANFNPMANTDNGSCVFLTMGCTNPMALNYNPLATMDDGSCMLGEDVMATEEWVGLEAQLWGEDPDSGLSTYRLYAVFNDPAIEVVTVFGDENTPLEIAPTTGAFVQQPNGITFADELEATTPSDDTWLAIGSGDMLTYVGPDLTAFANDGATLAFNDAVGGAWFRIPGSGEAGHPDAEGRVLLGQFTHSSTASALLNLQYFDADGMPRQVQGASLTWPAIEAGDGGTDVDDAATNGCSGDLDEDGLISVNDLLELISQFGVICD